MKKNTYYIVSFLLVGAVLLAGRYFGFNLIERLLSAFLIGGIFEVIYRKKLKI